MPAAEWATATDVLILVVEFHDRAWASLKSAAARQNDAISVEQYIFQVSIDLSQSFLTHFRQLSGTAGCPLLSLITALHDHTYFRIACCKICCLEIFISDGNRLAVLGSFDESVPCLYSDLNVLTEPDAPRATNSGAVHVANGLKRILEQQHAERGRTDSVADKPEVPPGRLSAALSKAMCMVNRASIAGVTRSRILVLQCASDSAGQYIACMNAIFSAQRLGIVIDGICPTMEASSFIEQAAHMTGGTYLRVHTPNALLQCLLTCFSSNMKARGLLQRPAAKGLSFRSTCFCHAREVEIGFVCSACLSIFCAPQRKCLTCGSEFKASMDSSTTKSATATPDVR